MTSIPGLLLLAVLVGVPAGVGAFTFVYAKGFSYLSTDPRACVNCHVMNEQYDALAEERPPAHRDLRRLPSCRTQGLAKWMAKADHGFRHSAAFTLQNFKEPIEITPPDRRIVQENCVRCHGDFVHAVWRAAGAPPTSSTACTATPARATARGG